MFDTNDELGRSLVRELDGAFCKVDGACQHRFQGDTLTMLELFDIRGKTALVTGATSGLGYMIAEGLLQAGVRVWICARNPEDLKASVERLSVRGECHGIIADVSTDSGIRDIDSNLGDEALSILVNNAGVHVSSGLGSFSREDFERVLNVNLTATFLLTQALLPRLRKAASAADPARVINIASINGMRPAKLDNFSYSTSKSAVLMLTRHLGGKLAPEDITVNTISPGYFSSRMTNAETDLNNPEVFARVASPIGKRVGTIEDIVGAVIYLSSRAGAWLTGVNIPLSGGRNVVD